MLPFLALQAVIIPVILSFLLFMAAKKLVFVESNITPLILLCWLFLYVWIFDVPNLPPRQALDWLGIISLLIIIPFFILPINTLFGKLYLSFLSCCMFILGSWPVITYEASFSSHWSIWLELFLFFSIFLLFFFKHLRVHFNENNFSYFNVAFFLGVLGAITIINGSLLLGLLVFTYAFLLSFPAIADLFSRSIVNKQPELKASLHILLIIYLMLLCRLYGEIPLAFFIPLIFVLIFSLFNRILGPTSKYLPSLLSFCILLFSLWHEYLGQTTMPAYY